MKKFTLIAGMALVALGASAQSFNVEDGSVKTFAEKHGKGTYYNISMSELSVENLQKMGNKVVAIGPDEVTRHLYVWNGFEAGTVTTPAPGWDGEENMDMEYTSLTIKTDPGWTGAGWFIDEGSDIPATIDENTIFHLCYASTAAAPSSVGMSLWHDNNPKQAKFALGAAYVDNGTTFPVVGAAFSEDWQTIEVTLGQLKKLNPDFTIPTAFSGNYMVCLAGAVAGQNVSFDNAFLFTPEGGSAIEGVEADNAAAPVEYFNLQGVKVANPEGGLFIKVQGNKATKVVL